MARLRRSLYQGLVFLACNAVTAFIAARIASSWHREHQCLCNCELYYSSLSTKIVRNANLRPHNMTQLPKSVLSQRDSHFRSFKSIECTSEDQNEETEDDSTKIHFKFSLDPSTMKVCKPSSSNLEDRITKHTPPLPVYPASFPTVFFITPTYQRPTQKADLTSLCHTLMHIPDLLWIVIEDSFVKTNLVDKLLSRCRVDYVHLNLRTPKAYLPKPGESKWRYNRGVAQRNLGLNWLREHYAPGDCNGVVYFGDDDNKYDLRLFEMIRPTKAVSVFPVAFISALKFEGPVCRNGKAVKWHSIWSTTRAFPLDMAGFAVNLCLILENSHALIGLNKRGEKAELGYLETAFLEAFADRESAECVGSATEVYVWHTKTVNPDFSHEVDMPSDPRMEY